MDECFEIATRILFGDKERAAMAVARAARTGGSPSQPSGCARAAWELLDASELKNLRDRCRSVALKVLNDAAGAEDIAQSSMQRAFERIHQYRGDGPFSGWMAQIARNLAMDQVRSDARHATTGIEETADTAPSPESRAIARELIVATRECIDGLAPRQEAAFSLKLEGLDYATIADRLNVATGTIGATLVSARRRMAECLKAKGVLP